MTFSQLPQNGTQKPFVVAQQGHALDIATKYAFGSSVLLVNLANNVVPGGFYNYDGIDTEANICRLTNLGLILTHLNELYPIDPDDEGTTNALYTPKVLVLRQHSLKHDFFLEKAGFIPSISVCSIPSFTGNPKYLLSSDNMKRLKEKIALQFQVADDTGAEVLIASDFGFNSSRRQGNGIQVLIALYNQVLKEYYGNVRSVVFACPDQAFVDHLMSNIKVEY